MIFKDLEKSFIGYFRGERDGTNMQSRQVGNDVVCKVSGVC